MTTDELRIFILQMVADGKMKPEEVQPVIERMSEMVYVLPATTQVVLSKKGEKYLRERGL